MFPDSSTVWLRLLCNTAKRPLPIQECKTTWESVCFSADGYLLGSYRIATAPEPNSSRLTSFKSTCFDSPANNVGPWPASLGCTTNSYSSIKGWWAVRSYATGKPRTRPSFGSTTQTRDPSCAMPPVHHHLTLVNPGSRLVTCPVPASKATAIPSLIQIVSPE